LNVKQFIARTSYPFGDLGSEWLRQIADDLVFDTIDQHNAPIQSTQCVEQARSRKPDKRARVRDNDRLPVIADPEGIWECSFVGECSVVCPKGVDPAKAIQQTKLDTTTRFVLPYGNREE